MSFFRSHDHLSIIRSHWIALSHFESHRVALNHIELFSVALDHTKLESGADMRDYDYAILEFTIQQRRVINAQVTMVIFTVRKALKRKWWFYLVARIDVRDRNRSRCQMGRGPSNFIFDEPANSLVAMYLFHRHIGKGHCLASSLHHRPLFSPWAYEFPFSSPSLVPISSVTCAHCTDEIHSRE